MLTSHFKRKIAIAIATPAALCGLVLMLALPGAATAQSLEERVERLQERVDALDEGSKLVKWHLAGYASAGAVVSDSSEEPDSFTVGSFNPVFHFQYGEHVLFESELEIEVEDEGETELELEYSQINLLAADSLVFVLGKFLSPVGQFQERLHPAWINKLPDAPAGFGHGGAQPLSDVGVQFRGGIPLNGSVFTYAVAVGNGPRSGHHGPELEGFGGDNNDNKATSGRLGFLPSQAFEVGVSFMDAKIVGAEPDEPATGPDPTEGDFSLAGVDFAVTPGPWDFRGEYLSSELSAHLGQLGHGDTFVSQIPETEWDAWYVQLAYRISAEGFLGRLEPVVRVGELDITGNPAWTEDSEEQVALGLNYIIAPPVIIKIAVEQRTFTDPQPEVEEDRFLVQVAQGF